MSFVNTREILGDQATLDALIAHTLAELKDNGVTTIADYALYRNNGLVTVEMPNLLTVGSYAFVSCTALTTIIASNLTTIAQHAFDGCSNLTTVEFSNVTSVGNYAFQNCAKLDMVELPACTSVGGYIGKDNGPTGFDFTQKVTIGAGTFQDNKNMQHLILRSNKLCSLSDMSTFLGTFIGSGVGYIYVPTDLVDTYKTASNWSAYAAQIQPISAYPKTFTGSISDTWTQIFEAEQNGTYSSKYSIGDTKVVDIDGTDVLMKIVAMDTDVLASDNTQTAPITWISAGILENRKMNASLTTSGGWANSEMRTYMRETLFPKIESTVRLNIKEVTKTYRSKTPTDSTLTTSDTVWIPSQREMLGGDTYEDSGVDYTTVFDSAGKKIKRTGKYGLGDSGTWWLRTAGSVQNFRAVGTDGTITNYTASNTRGLVLGFCT